MKSRIMLTFKGETKTKKYGLQTYGSCRQTGSLADQWMNLKNIKTSGY